MNNKERYHRQTFAYRHKIKSEKYIKRLRRNHLLDENTPFNELYFWAREVRMKDGHKCIQCGKRRKLTSHHLFNKCKYPLLKYNINNGVSLCFNCHIELHKLNDIITIV